MLSLYTILACAVLAVIGLLATRNRVAAKLGVRNINRRKKTSLLIVLGLMIGTALISSSMVIQDTMYYTFRKDVYDRLGEMDETVYSMDPNGTYRFFDYSIYEMVDLELMDRIPERVDGISPLIVLHLPVYDAVSDLVEPNVFIIGFNASVERNFGSEDDHFTTVDGRMIDGTELHEGGIIMNRRCADELEAQVNDNVTIHYGPQAFNFTVSYIVRNEGKANLDRSPMLYVPLETLQHHLNVPNKINLIKISNRGGADGGIEHSDRISSELRDIIRKDPNSWAKLEVDPVKDKNLANARKFSEFIGDIFTIMGTFVVAAGLVLILLIFVMLAEERRAEMGILRAVGMKRKQLMLSFLFEGTIYSIAAVMSGAVAGLGISYVILYFMEMGTEMIFYFESASLLLSICMGFITTLFVILLSSWLVSRINIVRAIRKIPEPMTTSKRKIFVPLGAILLLTGTALTVIGIARHLDPDVGSDIVLVWGPVLLLLGISCTFFLYFSPRLLFSITGLGMAFWPLNPFLMFKGSGPEMFISSGLILVPGGVLFVVINSDFILNRFMRLFERGKGKPSIPVLRIGMSYPSKRKFRTGMIMMIFTFVIFATSVEAIFTELEMESVRRTPDKQSGGYDLVCTVNPMTPIMNITDIINGSDDLDMRNFNEFTEIRSVRTRVCNSEDISEDSFTSYRIFGVGDDFLARNDYSFYRLAPEYHTAGDAWSALGENSSLAVIDRSVVKIEWDPFFGLLTVDVGEKITVKGRGGALVNVTIIGILDAFMVRETQGIFVANAFVERNFNVFHENMYLIDVKDGVDVKTQSKLLKREFMLQGMEVLVIIENVDFILDVERSIVTLMQGYMSIGLIVGIAGLGIIAIRSVVERTREIGMIRAIGFTRRMVITAFMIENLFMVILACFIGVLMGIGIGHQAYQELFAGDVEFIIPWIDIIILASVAIVATVVIGIFPGRKAANVPPSEALRYVE